MEYPEGIAAKRRVLIDALTLVLQRSKVGEKVDAATMKSVFDAAGAELWREGEFRLEYVWKILCQQPGLSAKEVAPPLFVFKSYEEVLAVAVRLPQALSAVPRGEQVRLREEVTLPKEEFTQKLSELQQAAMAEQETRAKQAADARAEKDSERPAEQPSYASPGKKAAPKKPINPLVAVALLVVAVAAVAIALFVTLRNTAQPADLADTASLLHLENGQRVGPSMSATIVDPRWETMPKEQREKVANQLFDLEQAKGIRSMILRDSSGQVRVDASEVGPTKSVTVR